MANPTLPTDTSGSMFQSSSLITTDGNAPQVVSNGHAIIVSADGSCWDSVSNAFVGIDQTNLKPGGNN